MKRATFAALLLCVVLPDAAFPAQIPDSRERLKIFFPMPTGGSLVQRHFFDEQFRSELIGARYPIVEKKEDSVYTLLLNIEDNPEYGLYEGEGRFSLSLRLMRSKDNLEIVQFNFPFTQNEEMYNWNLFLVYQALANAVLPDEFADDGSIEMEDWWRNKWLYLSGGLGMDLGYFTRPRTLAARQGVALPAARLGVELHFLNFMSFELTPFKAGFIHDGETMQFEPAVGAMFKWVFKPLSDLMIEPYAGAEYTLPFFAEGQEGRLSAMAGAQAGFHGGARGAVFFDFNVAGTLLGQARLANGSEGGVMKFTLMVGYKVGFWNRQKKKAKTETPSPQETPPEEIPQDTPEEAPPETPNEW